MLASIDELDEEKYMLYSVPNQDTSVMPIPLQKLMESLWQTELENRESIKRHTTIISEAKQLRTELKHKIKRSDEE